MDKSEQVEELATIEFLAKAVRDAVVADRATLLDSIVEEKKIFDGQYLVTKVTFVYTGDVALDVEARK